MKHFIYYMFCLLLLACNFPEKTDKKGININKDTVINETSLIILGTIQDGGSPHIGCKKTCCKPLFTQSNELRKVVSLGIIDPQHKKSYIFECTPDFTKQAKKLHNYSPFSEQEIPDGIFLTHAHIGHYSGLMYLGKEAMNANQINVFVMPRMQQFLTSNGPWSQLVSKKNIVLKPLQNNQSITLTPNILVTPIQVPHRDEFSETVGYVITGPTKKVLFIPDIDKWEKWEKDIIKMIAEVDYAFIDGTFYNGDEINNRNIEEIPHPFIIESMNLFKTLSVNEKNKIYFTHFNHTNKALDETSNEYKSILSNGFHVAQVNQIIKL